MSRFSQAISEGDGISVVPALSGDLPALASAAEAAGAEAVAVATARDVERVREAVAVPVLAREQVRERELVSELRVAGADALVLVFGDLAHEGELLELLHGQALELDLDCAVEVGDEEELARALERVDPEIVLIAGRESESEEEELERTLDLLPDVPAGKLVIAETQAVGREQIVALERAGVDAVVVHNLSGREELARAVEELARGR